MYENSPSTLPPLTHPNQPTMQGTGESSVPNQQRWYAKMEDRYTQPAAVVCKNGRSVYPTSSGGTQKWKIGIPNQQRWYAKWKMSTQPAAMVCKNGSSVGMCAHCVHVFYTFGTDLHAQSALINKISASELRRKFTKSPLLVGERSVERCIQY